MGDIYCLIAMQVQYRIYLPNESSPGNEQTGVAVTVGQITEDVDFTLNTAYGVIKGNVSTNSPGKKSTPLSSMSVGGRRLDNNSYTENSVTNFNGNYIISRVPYDSPQGFVIWCYGNGYVSKYWNNKITEQEGNPVYLDSSGMATGVDFSMEKGSVFTGQLTSSTGAQISSGNVYVYLQNEYSYSYSDNLNSTGWYEINSLPGGDFKLKFSANDYISEYYNNKYIYDYADIITVVTGTTTTINEELEYGAVISGRVTSTTGQPITSGTVYSYSQPGNQSSYGNLDGNGEYRITGLTGGDYKLRAYANGYLQEYYDNSPDSAGASIISLVTGESTVINFDLVLGGTISGQVVSTTGEPVINGTVYAYLQPSGDSYSDGLDSSGRYSVVGLKGGNYKLRVYTNDYLEEYYDNSFDSDGATLVNLADGENKSVDFEVQFGGVITGSVVNGSGSPVTSGTIYAYHQPDGNSRSTNLNSGGIYSVRGLFGGDFKVRVNASGYAQEYWDDKPDSSTADLVSVVTGELTSNINFTVNQGGGITGTIKDETGTPYTSGTVYLSLPGTPGTSAYSDSIDSSGVFSMSQVRAGTYYVFLYISGKPRIFYPYAFSLDDASQVTITDGSTLSGINFTIPKSIQYASASGYVLKGGVGVYCRAYMIGVDGYSNSTYDWTNSDNGEFSISNQYAGTFIFYADIDNRPKYYYGGTEDESLATRVTLNPGDDITDIIINVPTEDPNYGGVSGYVYDNNSKALSGATVSLYSTESYSMQSSYDGSYYFSQVLAGDDYTLRASKDGYNSAEKTDISVSEGALVSGQNLILTELSNPATVYGRVYNASGFALRDVYVDFDEDFINYDWYQYTDAYSEFYKDNVLPGNYDSYYSLSGYENSYFYDFDILPGQIFIQDVTLEFSPGYGVITGTVTDASGNPAYNIYMRSLGGTSRYVYTDINGTYFLSGLNPGTDYSVNCYYEIGVSDVTGIEVVADQITEGIDLTLPVSYAYVTGTVTNVTGDPIYKALIEGYPNGGSYYPDDVYTSYLGNYIMGRFRTDLGKSYTIYGKKNPYCRTYYDNVLYSASAEQVTFTPGEASKSGIDFSLFYGGSIAGEVENSAGVPIYNCNMYIRQQDGDGYGSTYYSDYGGRYLAEGLSPGKYKVRSIYGGYITEYYNDKITNASADEIIVTSGNITKDIDFTMSTGGAISGRVTDSTGNPLSSINVYVDSAQETECSGDDKTNSNGEYVIDGLYTDTYRVRAQFSGYTTQYIYGVAVTNNVTTENINFVLYRTDEFTPTPTLTPTITPTITPGGPTLTPTITPGGPTLTPTNTGVVPTHTNTPSPTPTGPTPTPRPGDLNNDGDVNWKDMLGLADGFIKGGTDNDLTGDGEVDYLDIFLFSQYWDN